MANLESSDMIKQRNIEKYHSSKTAALCVTQKTFTKTCAHQKRLAKSIF